MPRLLPEIASLLEPPERLAPSEWAERHRVLSRAETDRPGPWRNSVYPYLTSIMDCAQEAVETGRIGLCVMKSAQGGGTQAMLNVLGWAKCNLPGPSALVSAKDDQSTEMARTRVKPLIEGAAPLAERARWGRAAGQLVNRFRFVDGPLMCVGGRSITNLEAFPQRVLVFDELDSIQDEYVGRGDPLTHALVRMASFTVPTLAVVLAHPTTIERGTGRLYYQESDQRRGFAPCAHCGEEFWLQREHVRVLPEGKETPEEAARRPDRYAYVTPCCGVELSDADRWWMADRTTQRSVLEPAAAARMRWIGCHFSWFYMRSMTLEELAYNWVQSEGNPAQRQVVVNKQDGDVWKEVTREADPDAWRRCVSVPGYELGSVPSEVQYLTAGQDSRGAELHWAVWGWGLVRDAAGAGHLCGWLVDCGVERREPPRPVLEPADLSIFDQLLYERTWSRAGAGGEAWVAMGLHDAGWQPIAAYMYALGRRDGRAFPSKGAALDEVSASRAQMIAFQTRPGFRDPVTGETFREAHEQHAILNTFHLKGELVGMVETQFATAGGAVQGRVTLPRDVPARFLAESGSEYLTRDDRGRQVWAHRGPNHFADCNVMALGAAVYLARDLRETAEEQRQSAGEARSARAQAAEADERRRETGGGWWTGSRGGGSWVR